MSRRSKTTVPPATGAKPAALAPPLPTSLRQKVLLGAAVALWAAWLIYLSFLALS